ncbi:hypothetical protein HanIR_Chr16g0799511 [Helianthus annuus]|nr:hypothetical protein HanIR_Chr16g0799511 [Helianthus annuus]
MVDVDVVVAGGLMVAEVGRGRKEVVGIQPPSPFSSYSDLGRWLVVGSGAVAGGAVENSK